MYKTALAALYLYNDSLSDPQLASNFQTVSLTNNSGTLLASFANNSVMLAFNVSSHYRNLPILQCVNYQVFARGNTSMPVCTGKSG